MKKLFSVFVMIFLSLLFVWAIMSWYFGNEAEYDFRQSLEVHTNKLGEKPFRLELLEYHKLFLGSTAAIRVSSDIPLLNDWLGDFELTLNSLNGPLFITNKGVDFGVSRWLISMVPESFSAESLENLRIIFPETLPTAVLIVGFDKESSFQSSFQTEWLDSKVTGFYNLSTLSYRGAFDISRLNYSMSELTLSANDGTINFQYSNEVSSKNNGFIDNTVATANDKTTYKTASIQIPRLTINHQTLSYPVLASLAGNSQIVFENGMIETSIKVNFEKRSQLTEILEEILPIDKLEITAHSAGIQQSSFLQLMETKAELDNLRMQTQWELEEHGEMPEGQDKIWQLQNQINSLKQQYPVSFYKALFPSNETLESNSLSVEIKTSNDNGQSRLSGYLKPSVNSSDSTRFTDLLDAEAKVTLDDLLYSFISKRSAISKKQFSLSYRQNKLLMQ